MIRQERLISESNLYKQRQREVFSENFNRLLKEKGKTQADVYHAMKGIERQTVSAWACGKAVPRMDRVEALARFFGVEKSELLEPEHTVEIEKLFSKIRKLSPDAVASLNAYVDFLLSDKNNRREI